jgi:hypothetical protein
MVASCQHCGWYPCLPNMEYRALKILGTALYAFLRYVKVMVSGLGAFLGEELLMA